MHTTTAPKTQKTTANTQYHHALITNLQSRKFHPASRRERLASWDRRMQSLFTRQAY